jgi:hypothetical protein
VLRSHEPLAMFYTAAKITKGRARCINHGLECLVI